MPKSTRAKKTTDVRANKPWLKKVGIDKYRIETMNKKTSFLIICEGQTEELYFKSFPVLSADIECIHQGCSKTALVECVSHYTEGESYDEIWCVFDMDLKGDNKTQNNDFDNAIRIAGEAGYHCAYSNDCFELWFILHYQFIDAKHLRTTYFEILSDLWNIRYVRHGKQKVFANEIYDRLFHDIKANQDQAIEHAERLYNDQAEMPYHEQNPVTTVYKLVQKLNLHLRD